VWTAFAWMGAALVAAGGPAALRVDVADPSGAPIRGASVRVEAAGSSFSAVSNTRGRAVLPHLPSGEAVLRAEAAQFIARSQAIVLRAGENRIAWQLRMAPHKDAITVTEGDESERGKR